jgi:hypothetical protein
MFSSSIEIKIEPSEPLFRRVTDENGKLQPSIFVCDDLWKDVAQQQRDKQTRSLVTAAQYAAQYGFQHS